MSPMRFVGNREYVPTNQHWGPVSYVSTNHGKNTHLLQDLSLLLPRAGLVKLCAILDSGVSNIQSKGRIPTKSALRSFSASA